MMTETPSLDLVEFVETQILPQYAQFDKAHNLQHVQKVIRSSLELAHKMGADLNMAYAIAAYHDLGLSGPRAIHHLTSGKILIQDARLKRWFSAKQIKIMKEAVEDHRASASRTPRSIYGKIVAEADRDIQPETVIRRTIQFGLANYPQLDREGHWQRFMQHMEEKYSANGYIRLWIQGSENEKRLQELRTLIEQPQQMRPVFERLFEEETVEKAKNVK
ncbi:MAG: HD domain-containing protein [Prevotella sp.]|nr:HD domain-containing protein [Prevotella sp.]